MNKVFQCVKYLFDHFSLCYKYSNTFHQPAHLVVVHALNTVSSYEENVELEK